MNFVSQWEKLNHKQKRGIVIALVLVVIFGAVYLFGEAPDEGDKRARKQEDAIRSVLTDKSTRDISIDSLSASMQIVTRQNDELKKEISRISSELDRAKETNATTLALDQQLVQLRAEVTRLQNSTDEQFALARMARDANDANEDDDAEGTDSGQRKEPTLAAQTPPDSASDHDVFATAPPPALHRGYNENTGESIPLKIVTHSQPEAAITEDASKEEAIYIPAGSILTGVLLNGLDAPTGQGARRDPFPSTLRVQKEAVLPNRFQADVKECFMIVSGYGDLSSERAYLRGETISCVREDGGVIEARLNSYVVGEDGKAGVRGRLVSKQGQIIAKSLMAGFMSGMANAFDVNPVPVLNTAPDGRTQYQRTFSDDMIQGAAMKGASTALDRVAKFYIDMAESMFPVIEIDAGRQVDVIVTSGMSLKIRS